MVLQQSLAARYDNKNKCRRVGPFYSIGQDKTIKQKGSLVSTWLIKSSLLCTS